MQFFKILNIISKKTSFIIFFIIVFYKIFIKLRSTFDLLNIIYWKLLQHCLAIKNIYISILKIWWFFIFILIFYVFPISFCILINKVTYSSSNTFFLPLITYWYQLKDLILHLPFLKLLGMVIQELKEAFQDQALIFEETYFKSFNTSADNNEVFYFRIFTNCFCICIFYTSNIFHL